LDRDPIYEKFDAIQQTLLNDIERIKAKLDKIKSTGKVDSSDEEDLARMGIDIGVKKKQSP